MPLGGIVKADVGIKDGRIWAHRQGRQPGCPARGGPSPSAPAPRSIAGEGMILTAGGIDSHIHFICPQQIEEALASGVSPPCFGGGTGPATGTCATTCTPGPWHIAAHAAGGRRLPDEPRLPRQGQRQSAGAQREQVRAGASGSSCTRTGAPRRRRSTTASNVAEEIDVQVAIHTDTLNESGFVETRSPPSRAAPSIPSTPRARAAATRPTSSRSVGLPNVLPVLDQPDPALHREHHRRASRHAHGLPSPRPRHRRGRRLRREPHPRETIAAEDILHDWAPSA
jgi:urease subunit alpha